MLRRSKVKGLNTSNAARLCLALAAVGLLAQKPDDVVIKVDARLVVLHTTVVDKNGRMITTLPQNAFQVFENR